MSAPTKKISLSLARLEYGVRKFQSPPIQPPPTAHFRFPIFSRLSLSSSAFSMHANLFTRLPLLPIFSAKASLSLSLEIRRAETAERERGGGGENFASSFSSSSLWRQKLGGFCGGRGSSLWRGGGERSRISYAQNMLNNYSTSSTRPQILTVDLSSFILQKTLGIFLVQRGCGGGVVDQKFF